MVGYPISGRDARAAARMLGTMAALRGGLTHEALERVYGYLWPADGLETVVAIGLMDGLLEVRDGMYHATGRGAQL
ncbi:MAG TPA: hypothetical protein VJB16_01800 [archaeon]|nr:hypothetical protein [archaeon]